MAPERRQRDGDDVVAEGDGVLAEVREHELAFSRVPSRALFTASTRSWPPRWASSMRNGRAAERTLPPPGVGLRVVDTFADVTDDDFEIINSVGVTIH